MKRSTVKVVELDGSSLTQEDLFRIVSEKDVKVAISKKAIQAINQSREFVEKHLVSEIIYGVNTGFGPMASHIIGKNQLLELQENLVRSHAVGMGEPIKSEYALASMVVRLNTFVKGYSGISLELAKRIETFINHRIIPVVPDHGAVGTSGDLVQLAHIALALMGEGEVFYKGKKQDTAKVLKALKISQYKLKSKEGLSFINGTSVMTGISALLSVQAENLLALAIKLGALSLECVNGFDDSISKKLHEVRPHEGQLMVARELRSILSSSNLLQKRIVFSRKHKIIDTVHEISESVQEIYSIRCIPQILGPIQETIECVKRVVQIEMNSVTDNPIVDYEGGMFLHGGNFHGDAVATAVDQLKMVLVKLTMLSERRIAFFLNHRANGKFPPFLNLNTPGVTLALQGLQFVATSTTARSQTLAFPQSIHSIPTNGGNQDVVSMGTDAALIAATVVEHAYIVLAIEMVTLAQAVDCAKIENRLSDETRKLYKKTRASVSTITADTVITKNLENLLQDIKATARD